MIMLACASPVHFNTWSINHKRLRVGQLGSVRTGERSSLVGWLASAGSSNGLSVAVGSELELELTRASDVGCRMSSVESRSGNGSKLFAHSSAVFDFGGA